MAPKTFAESLMLPVLALWSPAPRSFTAQDVLELQTPGNPALLERVLHALLGALRDGDRVARLAEPGEFTHRAFAAGRIDLTRAEGIAATIGAESDAQLGAARLLRRGELGRRAEAWVDRLAQLLALVEAGIDFIDQDDVVPIAPAALDDGLAAVETEVDRMLRRARSWSALEALPWVVLVGEPNVGKSTLFNALLGRERAVTASIAGTTRDVLTEPMHVAEPEGEAEVMLVDIAGLDAAESALDRAMQQAAQAAIDRAELLLLVFDGDAPPVPPRNNVPMIAVRTKGDLCDDVSGLIAVSAVTGAGLSDLRRRIAEALRERAVALSGELLALGPRHRDAFDRTRRALRQARAMLADQRGAEALADMELIAESMRIALDHLGAVGGAMTADDVIGKVFATFCVGK